MLSAIGDVLLQPLFWIYGAIFSSMPTSMSVGLSIVVFSIVLNLAITPLYNQIEQRSCSRRAIRREVERDIARIKRHFHGRERYFYIRTVHRQHNYHPLSELAGSADLLLQVVVFFTVYRFLSTYPAIQGALFGPIGDLGQPDGLLFGINLLPVVMTAVNALAVMVYVDDPRKRRQALALGLLFLVLLYSSAAGMVLYWTMNNLISLVRSMVQRRGLLLPPDQVRRFFRAIAEQQ